VWRSVCCRRSALSLCATGNARLTVSQLNIQYAREEAERQVGRDEERMVHAASLVSGVAPLFNEAGLSQNQLVQSDEYANLSTSLFAHHQQLRSHERNLAESCARLNISSLDLYKRLGGRLRDVARDVLVAVVGLSAEGQLELTARHRRTWTCRRSRPRARRQAWPSTSG
jgi:hypothetical protein